MKFIALILSASVAVSAIAHAQVTTSFGVLSSGSPQSSGSAAAPVVTALTCNGFSPVANGVNVSLQGGGTCAFSATCGGAACNGINIITGWAVTAQTTANAYTITSAGIVQGGSAGATIISQNDTVTVTATNSTGTSPGVAQPVDTIFCCSSIALGMP